MSKHFALIQSFNEIVTRAILVTCLWLGSDAAFRVALVLVALMALRGVVVFSAEVREKLWRACWDLGWSPQYERVAYPLTSLADFLLLLTAAAVGWKALLPLLVLSAVGDYRRMQAFMQRWRLTHDLARSVRDRRVI